MAEIGRQAVGVCRVWPGSYWVDVKGIAVVQGAGAQAAWLCAAASVCPRATRLR